MADGIPFTDDMPANGLRAAYENYHAARLQLARLLNEVAIEAGRVVELGAQVVRKGGEI